MSGYRLIEVMMYLYQNITATHPLAFQGLLLQLYYHGRLSMQKKQKGMDSYAETHFSQ